LGNASPNPCDKTKTFAALTWGQGEALANISLGYDSHIVVANASPLQKSPKSQISRLFLFVEFLAKRDRITIIPSYRRGEAFPPTIYDITNN